MKKKVYNYDKFGLYIGESEADESPKEPGVFLIPANSTLKKPKQEKHGEVAKFVDGEWVMFSMPQRASELAEAENEMIEKEKIKEEKKHTQKEVNEKVLTMEKKIDMLMGLLNIN